MKDIFGCYLSISIYKFDKEADTFIGNLLDRCSPVISIDEYKVVFKLKGKYVEVWIANRWYAYGSRAYMTKPYDQYMDLFICDENLWDRKRISRKNKLRLYRYIRAYQENNKQITLLERINESMEKEVNL